MLASPKGYYSNLCNTVQNSPKPQQHRVWLNYITRLLWVEGLANPVHTTSYTTLKVTCICSECCQNLTSKPLAAPLYITVVKLLVSSASSHCKHDMGSQSENRKSTPKLLPASASGSSARPTEL